MADRDGISYEWGVDAKMSGVEAGVKTLDTAIASTAHLDKATLALSAAATKLSDAMGKASSSVKKHHDHTAESFKGIGHSIEDVKGKLSGFGEFIGAAIVFEGVMKGIELFKDLGMEILNAAAHAERLELSMKLSLGEEGSKETLDWIEKFASKTEFTATQLKGWAGDLGAAGVKAKDIQTYLVAGLDVAAKMGPAGMASAMGAFQMAQVRKISGRMLRPLGISLDDIREKLPGFKGLTDEQAHKKLAKTDITKEQMMGLIAGEDGMLGDKGIQAADTMGAKLKNLGDLKELLFEKFKDTEAFTDLKEKLGDAFDQLKPGSPAGDAITGGIEAIGKELVGVIGTIDFSKVGETITNDIVPGIIGFIELLKSMLPIITVISHAFGFWGKALHSTFGKDNKVEQVAHDAQALAKDKADQGKGFWAKVWDMGTTSGWDQIKQSHALKQAKENQGKDYLAQFGPQAGEKGAAIGEGLAGGIEGSNSKVADATGALGDTSIDALSDKIKAHSPSEVFEELGKNTGDGFVAGIEKSRGAIDDVMKGAFAVPVPSGGGGMASGMGGGITLTIPVTVQAHAGQNPDEVGRAIGEQIRAVVLPMLIDALEQAGAEAAA